MQTDPSPTAASSLDGTAELVASDGLDSPGSSRTTSTSASTATTPLTAQAMRPWVGLSVGAWLVLWGARRGALMGLVRGVALVGGSALCYGALKGADGLLLKGKTFDETTTGPAGEDTLDSPLARKATTADRAVAASAGDNPAASTLLSSSSPSSGAGQRDAPRSPLTGVPSERDAASVTSSERA
ncbi:MAG: hypothetical protein V4739_16425 [Pseudomonadota bacterium]